VNVADHFRGIDLKIGRAREHANELIRTYNQWGERAGLKIDAELLPGRLGFRLVLREYSEPPPTDRWALLVGDCVHNLRSSLDNLAYALALVKRDPPSDPHGIGFPIFDDEAAFQMRAVRTLKQLPDDAAALLTSVQPFHHGKETAKRVALRLLQYLSNNDKHRVPQITLCCIELGGQVPELNFQSPEDAIAAMPPKACRMHSGHAVPGTCLLEIEVTRPIARLEGSGKVQPVPAIQTLVGLEGVIPVLETLGITVQVINHAARELESVGSHG